MKALKKILAVACAVVTVTTIPAISAEAANVLATYSFDTTDGLTDPGFGTPPSIVQDAERGNVLQFADGESSTYQTETGNNKGVHKCEIVGGSPSTFEIANPYENSGLTSMTYSFWVKVTDPSATENGAGVLGFVSAEYTADHPDARANVKTQEEVGWWEEGVYVFGTSVARTNLMGVKEIPMLNFAGLYHNWYIYNNEDVDLADSTWHHIIVTTDSSCANTKVYLDGEDIGGYGNLGKRFNHGELDNSNPPNTMELTLMETICMEGSKIYLGQTGSNPTSSAVFIDDVTFFDSIVTDAEALTIYNEAKASSSTAGGSSSGSNSSADQSANNQQSTSTVVNTNNANQGTTTTPNLPQTGTELPVVVASVGVVIALIGVVLLKKKEA